MNKLLLCLVLSFFASCSNNNHSIPDLANNEDGMKLAKDLSSYVLPHAEVSKKTQKDDHTYYLTFIHDYTNQPQDYHAVYIDSINFTHYNTLWINDTALQITLVNSDTDYEKQVLLWGNGPTTGMDTND